MTKDTSWEKNSLVEIYQKYTTLTLSVSLLSALEDFEELIWVSFSVSS